MPLSQLDHYTIRTDKLEATRDFYVDVLEVREGDRPPFDFPGYWLYLGDHPVVHLIGLEPGGSAQAATRTREPETGPFFGSGAIDHLAFRGTEPEKLRRRLVAGGVPFRELEVPDMDLFQIFLEDPNGVLVEINYWGA